MATPAQKAPALENMMINMFGFDRRTFIENNKCVPAPIGCGGDATEFDNESSQREYTLSGMCQACQNKFFGENEDDCC